MSCYYFFRIPHSRECLEEIGVKFLDGEIEVRQEGTKPYTWIVEGNQELGYTNYLHPEYDCDGLIIGWTRYGENTSENLNDLLENVFFEFCSEYDLEMPFYEVADLMGYDVDNVEGEEEIMDWLNNGLDLIEYYFSEDQEGFLESWIKENKNHLEIIKRKYLKEPK